MKIKSFNHRLRNGIVPVEQSGNKSPVQYVQFVIHLFIYFCSLNEGALIEQFYNVSYTLNVPSRVANIFNHFDIFLVVFFDKFLHYSVILKKVEL